VAKVVEPEAWHVRLAACAGESLTYCVAAHGLAVAPDEHPVRPGPFGHVHSEDREHVRRDVDGSLARVGLGRRVEGAASFKEFDAVRSDGNGCGGQVDVLRR